MTPAEQRLRALIEATSAREKAERIRTIVEAAEARGIRAEFDIDDAELLRGWEFRLVSIYDLLAAADALAAASRDWQHLMELNAHIIRETGFDLEAFVAECEA